MEVKKTIAVLSTYGWIQKENNYGSLFQYYALQEFLKSKGHKAYWIKYNPIKKRLPRKNLPTIKATNSDVKFARKILSFIKKTTQELKKRITERINKHFISLSRQCSKEIQSFMNDHLNLSENEYLSLDEIKKNPPLADVYIVGSDQVWSYINEAYYLEFVPEGKKRFSYAASFGKSEFSADESQAISKFLSKFERVSVREKRGVEICNTAGRKDAVQVVDPTFLLCKEQYYDLIDNSPKANSPYSSYVFSYFLNIYNSSEVYWNTIHDFVKNESLDLVIVPVQGAECLFPRKYVDMPSPTNWLKYISNASYVITNSFHGTLFSIIMEKPFLIILQGGETSSENNRFFSLLEVLGLESRIFDPKKGSLQQQITSPINWQNVEKQKGQLVGVSKEFIVSCGL